MKIVVLALCLLLVVPAVTEAQLVVFDRSHNTQVWDIYGDFRDQLVAWGYTVEIRTTALMDNTDADVIVILPEDAFSLSSTDYTSAEAGWLKDFVDGGKGLLAAHCLNSGYWAHIEEMMDVFGISEGDTTFVPVVYDSFEVHPIFDGVSELSDDFGQCGAITVAAPSTEVAWNTGHPMMALYESGEGCALWTSHYYLMSDQGLEDSDNLVFLANLFEYLTGGGVSNEDRAWGDVKRLFQ